MMLEPNCSWLMAKLDELITDKWGIYLRLLNSHYYSHLLTIK